MNDLGGDDNVIVRRVREGDRNAFAVLVRRYETRVRGYCMNTLRDASAAQDAAQEIFLKAFQALERFRGEAAFSSWLYRIMVNHCRDALRKSARNKAESLEDILEREGEGIEAQLAKPGAAGDRLDHAEQLERVLALLAPEQREIILLREAQGLSYGEIAEALDCSLDSVKGRLKRARAELMQRLRHFTPS